MRIARAFGAAAVALLTGAVVIGCGTAHSADEPTAAKPPRAPHDAVVDVPAPALRRHDAPPAGVQAQIDYYPGGGTMPCTFSSDGPGLAFGFDVDRLAEDEAVSAPPRIGDQLELCIDGADIPGRAELVVEAPARTLPARSLPVSPMASDVASGVLPLTPELGTGRWRMRLSYRGEVVTRSFEVGPAKDLGYRVLNSDGARPRLLVVGLEPGADFGVHVYRPRPRTAEQTDLLADHVTGVSARAGADGTASVSFHPTEPYECFIVNVVVDGRVLPDHDGFGSTFCWKPQQ